MRNAVVDKSRGSSARRATLALRSVLPVSAEMAVLSEHDGVGEVKVAGRHLRVGWAGEGWTADVRRLLEGDSGLDVVAARRLSPGARATLDEALVGWVDELGNAEIAIGTMVISRTGRLEVTPVRPPRWTPGFVSVAEAILCGVGATVAATAHATGLSTGTCTNALRTLTDLRLLETDAERGRAAGRRAADRDTLLKA